MEGAFSKCVYSIFRLIILLIFFEVSINSGSSMQTMNCTNFIIPFKEKIERARDQNITLFLEPALQECIDAHPYDKRHFPIIKGSPKQGFEITYSVYLNELVKVNPGGALSLSVMATFSWVDQYRSWNYDEIPVDKIRIPSSEIWFPIFMLENCESDNCYLTPDNNTYSRINKNGRVHYTIMKLLEVNCNLNLTLFPFDQEHCKMVILYMGSNDVIINPDDTSIRMFEVESDEWDVLSVVDWPVNFTKKVYRRSKEGKFEFSKNSPTTNPGFIVSIAMRRYASYYVCNLICPVVIISILGFFTIFLPPTSDAKINMAVTVLLGFLFVQTIISEIFPKTSDNPYLSTYTVLALSFSAINLIGSIVVVASYNLAGKKAAPLIVKIILPIFQLLMCIVPCRERKHQEKHAKEKAEQSRKGDESNQEVLLKIPKENMDALGELTWKSLAFALNRLFFLTYLVGSLAIVVIFFAPLVFQEDITRYVSVPEVQKFVDQQGRQSLNILNFGNLETVPKNQTE